MNALPVQPQARLNHNGLITRKTRDRDGEVCYRPLPFQGEHNFPISASGPIKPQTTLRQKLSKVAMGFVAILGLSVGVLQLVPSKPQPVQNNDPIVLTQESPPVKASPDASGPIPSQYLPIDPNYPAYPHSVGMRGRGIFNNGGCVLNNDPFLHQRDFQQNALGLDSFYAP